MWPRTGILFWNSQNVTYVQMELFPCLCATCPCIQEVLFLSGPAGTKPSVMKLIDGRHVYLTSLNLQLLSETTQSLCTHVLQRQQKMQHSKETQNNHNVTQNNHKETEAQSETEEASMWSKTKTSDHELNSEADTVAKGLSVVRTIKASVEVWVFFLCVLIRLLEDERGRLPDKSSFWVLPNSAMD